MHRTNGPLDYCVTDCQANRVLG